MSDLIVYDCEQGSPEWISARLGIPTASQFSTVMAKGRGNSPSKTRRSYMLKLLGERLTGEPQEAFTNGHMERGRLLEPEARDLYAFATGEEPETVGFMRRGMVGASPDFLIGDDGGGEIKCPTAHVHLEAVLSDSVPTEHMPQIQGCMMVSGRDWWHFVSYHPGLPLFVKRVARDEEYIKRIADEVARFNEELRTLEAKLSPEYEVSYVAATPEPAPDTIPVLF